MIEVRELRLVKAIDDHGSLVRAARVLGIAQPAMTRALARLEARLATARRPEYFNADKRSRVLCMNFRCLWTISRVAMLIQRNSTKRFRVQSDAHRPINKEKTICRLAQS